VFAGLKANACLVSTTLILNRPSPPAGPCNYPGNAYSNKRWCCGDNSNTQGTHFDLSIW
jgi:hypothetical protein